MCEVVFFLIVLTGTINIIVASFLHCNVGEGNHKSIKTGA
jgi:hypothetical protein